MHVGILGFAEMRITPTVSVVAEAGYVQRGFETNFEYRDEQNNPDGTLKYDERIDYLTFSAGAKARLSMGKVAPFLFAGPRLDFLVGYANRLRYKGPRDVDLPQSEFPKSSMQAFHFISPVAGGVVAVGTEISTPLMAIQSIELRYSFDLINSTPDVPRDTYNNSWELLIAFGI